MLQVPVKRSRANVQLYKLVTKSITPLVLIIGLCVLAVYHFSTVLQTTQSQDNLYQGITALSQGKLEMDFQRDAGFDRPALKYDGFEFMSYSELDSVIAVDGVVQDLWDSYHGYSLDTAHNQLFITTSGNSWQVTQVVKVVNEHTITVTYLFTARHVGLASPHQIRLSIAHLHDSAQTALWFYPTVQGQRFTAEELPLAAQNPKVPYGPNDAVTVYPLGTTSLTLSGPAVAGASALLIQNSGSALAHGQQESWAPEFTTQYEVTDPGVDQLITLGVETITFQPAAANTGTPVILPLSS